MKGQHWLLWLFQRTSHNLLRRTALIPQAADIVHGDFTIVKFQNAGFADNLPLFSDDVLDDFPAQFSGGNNS